MKLAHLADLHLGFRQFHRQTPQGINQREADVAGAFGRTIDDVIAAQPDLVIVAGDVFHSVRPTNSAILESFHQFRRLRGALPEAPVVVIAGNHDTPRSVETGTILKLFEAIPEVSVVADQTRTLPFERLDLAVTCVPHAALALQRPALVPPPGMMARWKVLMTHGEIAGVLPGDRSSLEYGGVVLEPAELHADRWSYVALGHYHVAHRVAENAWYAGALEYVSPNPWGELRDEEREKRRGQKGWLLVELGKRLRVEFRAVRLTRRLVDLEPIDGAARTPQDLSRMIARRVEDAPGGIENNVVRQVVYNVPRPVARDLDHARIRDFKARALHYQLDIRRPRAPRETGVGAPGKRLTLPEIVRDYLAGRPLDASMDRQRLLALAHQYLERVEAESASEV